jgi:hypothetical protein
MNMKKLVTIVAVMAMVAPSTFAITKAQEKAIRKAVTSVAVAEMPAKAAQLVTESAKQDREAVAVTAVRAGIYKSRSSARLIVSAVAKAAPEVAGAIVKVAAEMEPAEAGYIATAAITAAPGAKNDIITKVNEAPKSPSAPTARSVVARGAAAAPGTVPVTQSATPINTTAAGSGNGTFPAGQPTQAGNPAIVDYTQPRT